MQEHMRLLVKVATLYYQNELTQQQIAERLDLSRQSVGRLLQRAQELGIVHIEIRSPIPQVTELESLLEQTFGLKEAIVVEPGIYEDEAIKQAIGRGAADFVQRHLHDDDIIGVSWSSTVYQMAVHLEKIDVKNVTVVGLNGSLNVTTYPTHAEFVIHRLAEMTGGTAMLLAAPMFVERPEIKEMLLTDSTIASVLKLAQQSHLAVFGIGDLSEHSSPYKAGYINDKMLKRLIATGVAGDICGRFFDINGNPCVSELAQRTIAVELSHLQTKRLAVGVAGGLRKVDAILGALRGKFCNVLVTDWVAAREILKRSGIADLPPEPQLLDHQLP